MKQLVVTAEAEQFITEYLDDGSIVTFKLNYRPNALGWFINVEYDDKTYRNIKLVSGTNILRPFANLMNFDLYVKTTELMVEPYIVDSFSLGLAQLYLVDLDERDDILNGQIE